MSFLSGACDGEVRIWDLPSQKTIWSVYAHKKFVRGLTVDRTGSTFLSCSDDCTIKQYQLNMDIDGVCFPKSGSRGIRESRPQSTSPIH